MQMSFEWHSQVRTSNIERGKCSQVCFIRAVSCTLLFNRKPYAQKRYIMICRRVCGENSADAIPSAMLETLRKEKKRRKEEVEFAQIDGSA